jgi:hypothetical protein
MKDSEWDEYFTKRLAEAEKELANYNNAVAKHGLRIYHRDRNGERDMTEHERKDLEERVAEYRRALASEESRD